MLSNKTLFLIALTTSMVVAVLLFFGRIDQDFYSFYYIGRGINEGKEMFRDFPDNKGPVLYVFFMLLNFFFKENTRLAVVIGNGLLDSISLYLLFRILRDFYGIRFEKKASVVFALISLCLVYKSFSIGSLMGGIYSETLGMIFFLSAFWLFKSRKFFTAGLFFTFSIFTRISFLFFFPFFSLAPFIDKEKQGGLSIFIKGIFCGFIAIILPFILSRNFNDLINNMLIYNLNYGYTAQRFQLLSLMLNPLLETRIVLIFFFISLLVVITSYKKNSKSYSLLLFYICSLLSWQDYQTFVADSPGPK